MYWIFLACVKDATGLQSSVLCECVCVCVCVCVNLSEHEEQGAFLKKTKLENLLYKMSQGKKMETQFLKK